MGHNEDFPNEAEFQAYSLLSQAWRDENISRLEWTMKPHVFLDSRLQLAIEIRSLFSLIGQSDGTINHPARLFNLLRKETTPYLVTCCVHIHFVEIRRKTLESVNNVYYRYGSDGFLISDLVQILGFDSEENVISMLNSFSINTTNVDGKARAMIGKMVLPNQKPSLTLFEEVKNANGKTTPFPPTKAKMIVDVKRTELSDVQIIRGKQLKIAKSVKFNVEPISVLKRNNDFSTSLVPPLSNIFKPFAVSQPIKANVNIVPNPFPYIFSEPPRTVPAQITPAILPPVSTPYFNSVMLPTQPKPVQLPQFSFIEPLNRTNAINLSKNQTPTLNMSEVIRELSQECYYKFINDEIKSIVLDWYTKVLYNQLLGKELEDIISECLLGERAFREMYILKCNYLDVVFEIYGSIEKEVTREFLIHFIEYERFIANRKNLLSKRVLKRWHRFIVVKNARTIQEKQNQDYFLLNIRESSIMARDTYDVNLSNHLAILRDLSSVSGLNSNHSDTWSHHISLSEVIYPILRRQYDSNYVRCKIVVFASPAEKRDTFNSLPYSWLKSKLAQSDSYTTDCSNVLTNSHLTIDSVDMRLFVELVDPSQVTIPENQVFLNNYKHNAQSALSGVNALIFQLDYFEGGDLNGYFQSQLGYLRKVALGLPLYARVPVLFIFWPSVYLEPDSFLAIV
jgi:hypothetical protein